MDKYIKRALGAEDRLDKQIVWLFIGAAIVSIGVPLLLIGLMSGWCNG